MASNLKGPGTKEDICVVCSKSGLAADVRRKLFCLEGPSRAYNNLKLLLGYSDINVNHSEIVCRSCADRNESLAKKVQEIRSHFNGTRKPFEDGHGEKRMRVESDGESLQIVQKVKRRAIVPDLEPNSKTTRDVATQTSQTSETPQGESSVYVGIV